MTFRRFVFGALFLSSGFALLVYIASGVSLLATLAVLTLGSLLLAFRIHRGLPPGRRMVLARQVLVGTISGCVGLAAYDGSRWLLVNVGHFRFKPFDVFYTFGQAIFGQAILGSGHSSWELWAVGIGFHLLNGIGFAIAYTVWAGRRGPLAGIVFALGLQALMTAVYPSWLRIQMLGEFLQASMIGHVAYGAAIGLTSRYLLRSRWRLPVGSASEV